MGIEHLDDLGKIEQGAGEPIDLVDHNDIQLRSTDVVQEALQSRALQRSPGIAAIIIVGRQSHPTFVLLACDKGLAGFALRIERVEVLLEPLLSRLARINGAAQLPAALLCADHRSPRHLKRPSSGLIRRSVGRTSGRQ